jgi:hypothetical protein
LLLAFWGDDLPGLWRVNEEAALCLSRPWEVSGVSVPCARQGERSYY